MCVCLHVLVPCFFLLVSALQFSFSFIVQIELDEKFSLSISFFYFHIEKANSVRFRSVHGAPFAEILERSICFVSKFRMATYHDKSI